ncbi:hypothetical protein T10_7923 [Trichinella papuae]|uniref:Uncharacterized protein n=1 Tax=Trichinella papuae TaxID=268474 RepID=A0A0V1LWB2_9BILA|nr:hypothetical protein T10_7923 [Trichinella papuae]
MVGSLIARKAHPPFMYVPSLPEATVVDSRNKSLCFQSFLWASF